VALTAAFFGGRLVSYSTYVGVASAAKHNLQGVFASAIASPWEIGRQVVMLLGLAVLARVDWARIVLARRRRPGPGST
jgi:hypothetical protein